MLWSDITGVVTVAWRLYVRAGVWVDTDGVAPVVATLPASEGICAAKSGKGRRICDSNSGKGDVVWIFGRLKEGVGIEGPFSWSFLPKAPRTDCSGRAGVLLSLISESER